MKTRLRYWMMFAASTASILIFFSTAASAQQILRVPQDVGSLGQAIQQISDGGIIEMANGTYTAPGGGFRARFVGKDFTIRAAAGATVTLTGSGNANIFFYEDSTTARVLTFENLIFDNGFSNDQSAGAGVTVLGGSAIFSGCTFRNNVVEAQSTGGAGVRAASGANVTFRNSTFQNNTATTRGAGLSVVNSTATIRRSRFINNRVDVPNHVSNAVGGAIHALNSSVRIEESRFAGNRAAFAGGALFGFGTWEDPVTSPKTTLTVINSTLVDNSVGPDPCCPINANLAVGGAIHVEDQTRLDVQTSRFFKNQGNWAGAISTYRAEVLIADSTFRGNSGELDGPIPPLGGTIAMTSADRNDPSTENGAINRPTGSLSITDTLIQGRFEEVGATAALGGCIFAEGDINRLLGQGGVAQDGSEASNQLDINISGLILADCAVAQPTAAGAVSGGGMAVSLVDMSLSDSVVFGGDTPTSGGGIAVLPSSDVEISNTTFADNSAQRGGGLHISGADVDVSDSQFFNNEVSLPAGGAAIFSIPVASRNKNVTGVVSNTLFADHANMPLVDGDFDDGPINDLRYDGNSFAVANAGEDVYQNTIDFVRSNVAELNSRVIDRSNGTSTAKSQVDNQALTNAPNAGAVVAGPAVVLTQSAVGDPAPPTSAFLGHAWRGASATLAGQNLNANSGLVEVQAPGNYRLRVGNQVVDTASVEERDVGGAGCSNASEGLCLNGDRFLVEVSWRDFDGNTGSGIAVPAPSVDSGLFFFFDADNWEVLIKVLFGCPINNHYWVFAAATTNVEYRLTVTDTLTGQQRQYFNPLGNSAAAVTDTMAFATCEASDAGATSQPVVRLDQPTEGVEVIGGTPPDLATRLAVNSTPKGAASNCVANSSQLFLNDDRFRVEVRWRDFMGNTGDGLVVPFCVADSGLFFFFDPDNWELLIKVLFGCPINNHYWVFSAATTNVEYTLTVIDTATGVEKTYFNPLGNAASAVTDTRAFATCP